MTDLTVPKTILEQLGGDDFIALTGATAFIGTEDSLTFRVGHNPKGVSLVRVTLTPGDLYAVTFFRTGKAPRMADDGRSLPSWMPRPLPRSPRPPRAIQRCG